MKKKLILSIVLCVSLILPTSNIVYAESGWSEWSEVVPPSGSTIESRTEYRYKTMIMTTSYEPSLEGYICCGSTWEKTGSGSFDYITSFPNGFNIGSSLYTNYNKQPVKATETTTNKTAVSTSTIGYLYYHWCRNGNYSGSLKNRTVSGTYSDKFWNFHAFTTGTALGWDSKGAFYGDLPSQCNDTYWWIGHGEGNAANIPIYRCTYSNYRKLFSYYKWSEYSEWSVLQPVETNGRLVEERTVYRYLKEIDESESSSSPTTTPASTERPNVIAKPESKTTKKAIPKVGQKVKKGLLVYKIAKVSVKKGKVTVIGGKNKKLKKVTIPRTIKVNGFTLKVTAIGKNAFKNYKMLSFLRIKSETIKKIGKCALKGTKKKLKVMVPASKIKKYSKMIKKARK